METASGVPGISTNNNPLESRNDGMGRAAALHNQSLGWFLKTGLGKVIGNYCHKSLPRNPNYCPSWTPSYIANKAMSFKLGELPSQTLITPSFSPLNPRRHLLFCCTRESSAPDSRLGCQAMAQNCSRLQNQPQQQHEQPTMQEGQKDEGRQAEHAENSEQLNSEAPPRPFAAEPEAAQLSATA